MTTGYACVGALRPGAADGLPDGDGPEVEVRDHGDRGVWVLGPADEVEALAPEWAARIGAPVRGWVVRVHRRGDLAVTEVVGRRWDPGGATSVLARESDDEDDGETPLLDIARGRLEIVLDLYEGLHQDDARLERRRLARRG
jgi:hypothetical protein